MERRRSPCAQVRVPRLCARAPVRPVALAPLGPCAPAPLWQWHSAPALVRLRACAPVLSCSCAPAPAFLWWWHSQCPWLVGAGPGDGELTPAWCPLPCSLLGDDVMVMRTARAIASGEELLISYATGRAGKSGPAVGGGSVGPLTAAQLKARAQGRDGGSGRFAQCSFLPIEGTLEKGASPAAAGRAAAGAAGVRPCAAPQWLARCFLALFFPRH